MTMLSAFLETNAKRIYRNLVFPFRKLSLMLTKRVYFGLKAYADRGSDFDGDNYLGESGFMTKCHMGRGSYAADFVMLNELNCGKFCSIGSGVMTAIGTHPARDNITTSPSFFSLNPPTHFRLTDKQLFEESNGNVTLGNDVWVGNGAILMAGVRIHNGAVVGAGSLVTKDIPPYEIWAGVPAKKIGHRFSDEEIARLEKLCWWDKPDTWLKDNAKAFANPGEFLKRTYDE